MTFIRYYIQRSKKTQKRRIKDRKREGNLSIEHKITNSEGKKNCFGSFKILAIILVFVGTG